MTPEEAATKICSHIKRRIERSALDAAGFGPGHPVNHDHPVDYATGVIESVVKRVEARYQDVKETSPHTGKVVGEIEAERLRQMGEKDWSCVNDDEHRNDRSLAQAAAAYALQAARSTSPLLAYEQDQIKKVWPWDQTAWKPTNPRADLVRAAALIVAEIERLDRDSMPL